VTLAQQDRSLCSECIAEPLLSSQIELGGVPSTCFYCEAEKSTLPLSQIATSIGVVLDDFYHSTTPPEGQPIARLIGALAGVSDETAEDIRHILEEQDNRDWGKGFFDRFKQDRHYAKNESVNPHLFESEWRRFEESLKTETRYFNRFAESLLTSIFDGIDDYRTTSGRPVVVEAGPGTAIKTIYRARVFQSESEIREAMKRPDIDIGPPPPAKAYAGRMNAPGIAVFYGATEPSTALSEIRPPVGSKVLIGRFEIIRQLKLLDLVELNNISEPEGSVFDESYRYRLKRTGFLRGLGGTLAKPVLPNDEIIEYLPTQAVADFLATNANPALDGIIYPSVQVGSHRRYARNLVLFHKAARVRALDRGRLREVSSNSQWEWLIGDSLLDDSPDLRYTVLVTGDETATVVDGGSDGATLKFESLEVHSINGVEIRSRHSEVCRYRKPDKAECLF
jgi:hypothetical protein